MSSFLIILPKFSLQLNRYFTAGLRREEEEEGKYIGEIILTADQFTLHKDVVRTSEIKDLTIVIGYTKGHKHYHRYGYTVDNGTRSSIEFTLKGEKRHYNFQIYPSDILRT